MTWVKLDDSFFRHPKARAAGKDGRALFLAACCWSASNLTDGHIPAASLGLVASEAEVKVSTAERLVTVGLFHANGDGWVIHDFLAFNKSRERVHKERAQWAARQAKARGDDE